jgi:pimeloyl-ACP methyl ester carboxylesterase
LSNSEHVILLHGLWMRAFTLAALRRRLEQAGYSVEHFDYASVFRSTEVSIEHLLRRAQSVRARRLHFVGHSLGGLIAMQTLQRQPGLTSGRVVCLGSPLRGSAVARGIASVPGGALLIGKHLDILRSGLERWNGRQEVGAIAGRLPIGLGFAIGALATPHDGTVSVAETELPGLTDHCIIPATHTGLLFSAEAAEQTIAFLRHGCFTGRD